MFLDHTTDDVNAIAAYVRFDAEGGAPLESYSFDHDVTAVPDPCPPEPERRSGWGIFARVVADVAVVAVVAVVTIATGGAALAVIGAVAKGAAIGAGIGAVTGFVMQSAVDIFWGDGFSLRRSLLAALDGAVTGAIVGAFAAVLPVGASAFSTMLHFGVAGLTADVALQFVEVVFEGGQFDPNRAALAFGLSAVFAGLPFLRNLRLPPGGSSPVLAGAGAYGGNVVVQTAATATAVSTGQVAVLAGGGALFPNILMANRDGGGGRGNRWSEDSPNYERTGRQHGNAPRSSHAQNRQFNEAVRQAERELGRTLSHTERQRLHQAISQQGYGLQEIVEEALVFQQIRNPIIWDIVFSI